MYTEQDKDAVLDLWLWNEDWDNPLVRDMPGHWVEVRRDLIDRTQIYLWVERGTDEILAFLAMMGDEVVALHLKHGLEEKGIEKILLLEAMKTRDVMTVVESDLHLRRIREYVKSFFHIERVVKNYEQYENQFTLAWRRYGKPKK